jgi:hypothetical protein
MPKGNHVDRSRIEHLNESDNSERINGPLDDSEIFLGISGLRAETITFETKNAESRIQFRQCGTDPE